MQKLCVDQAAEASALLPTVVLSATDTTGSDVLDARVGVDGVVVATVLDGKAIPIDPGLHTFRFEKAGLAPVERRVAIKEGQKGQTVEARFASAPATAPAVTPVIPVAAPVVAAPAPIPSPAPSPAKETQGSWTTLRWTGLGVGAAGVVGLGVGSIFGAMAFSRWSDAKSQCGTSCAPGSAAYATRGTGENDATISTVAFVAGGVLAAGGLVMFLAAPAKTSSPSAAIAPTPGGLQMIGRF